MTTFLHALRSFMEREYGKCPMSWGTPDVLACILLCVGRVKREVIAHATAGELPPDVSGFSGLHDYHDANWYGGAFGWAPDDDSWPSDTDDGEYQGRFADFWNSVQGRAHDWLAAGGLRKALGPKRLRQLRGDSGFVVA